LNKFSDGTYESVVYLKTPTYPEIVNLSIKADSSINSATIDIFSMPTDANSTTNPEGVQVFLDDMLLWEFNGSNYGPFGRQDTFFNDKSEVNMRIGPGGGTNSTMLCLPKNAKVLNTTMQADCSGSSGGLGLALKCIGSVPHESLGVWVFFAGDVNGDGYNDFIICSGNGHSYLIYGNSDIDNLTIVDVANELMTGVGDVNGDGYDDILATIESGYTSPGVVSLSFGGPKMNLTQDINFTGFNTGEGFGARADIGDVNGDGFNDVAIGARYNSSNGNKSGCVYIYYGGLYMDSSPDLILTGESAYDDFGGLQCVAGAGDVNNDDYDDVIVGAPFNDAGGDSAGRAYIYFGGKNMDNSSDLTITGSGQNAYLGVSVDCAGDVNGDGIDDVIVGENGAGNVLIFYGSSQMDNIADVKIHQAGIGRPVAGIGDINNDGFDDVATGGKYVYLYYGGQNMDTNVDETIYIDAISTGGHSISGEGDVDHDGYPDIIIGQPANKTNGGWCGAWYLYTHQSGILEPNATIGSTQIWSRLGYFNTSEEVDNFAITLNDFLQRASSSWTDEYGNSFVDIPISVAAKCEGNITLRNVGITYNYRTTTPDFAEKLNNYMLQHKSEQDMNGNLTVPIKVISRTPGRVKLSNLNIILDEGPRLVQKIPDVELKEDSVKLDLLDLTQYFKDDIDSGNSLKFTLKTLTNDSLVNVSIAMGKYISADSSTGSLNDNWTGEVRVIANCMNTRNQTRESNEFRIFVVNVNDPPVFTSTPTTAAIAGEEYSYQVTAEDGDGDVLTFNLSKGPQNMTINSNTGLVQWMPMTGGGYEVTIEVTDGIAKNVQNYIIVVPNRPPRMTNTTIPDAIVGVLYTYDIPAIDDDGNELNFGLLSVIPGMMIDPSSGRITWLPDKAGDYPVSVRISDRKDTIYYNFTIRVSTGNRNPQFTTTPGTSAITGMPYSYNVMASDEDGDILTFSILKGPAGMTVNGTSGQISWIPESAGFFNVQLKISDGRGGETTQEFTITVQNRTRPIIDYKTPSEGQKVRGKLTVTGTTTRGTLDIVKVQLRVDSGEWLDAAGNSTWTYSLDTTKLKDGRHTFQARAFDGMDYSDIVNRTVVVANSKPAGKGFIPGFDGLGALMGLVMGFVLYVQKKSKWKHMFI
jgi:hypothetical protein